MSDVDVGGDELLAKGLAMAERFGATAPTEEELVETEPTPLAKPTGFVDLVFEDARLTKILDANGRETEIGRWLEVGGANVLRIALPGLSDPAVNKPGASHRNGQSTERLAGAMVAPRSGTQRAQVLGTFISDYRAGGLGLIDEDVAARTQLNLYSAAPRRLELVNGGWLEATGRHGKTKLNGESKQWTLTSAAVEQLNLRRS